MIAEKERNKTKDYFTADTEIKLLEYVAESDPDIRNNLYTNYLTYPLFKLTENIINTYKFYYISDSFPEIQQMGIKFVLEKIVTHPINPERGKAFSYLTKMLINFYIQENIKAYKELKRSKPICADLKNLPDEGVDHDKIYFFDFIQDYLVLNSHIIFKDDEYDIANAIITVMKRRHNIDNLNKKKVYIYIKTMLESSSNFKITLVRKKMEVLYNHLFELYITNKLSLNYIPESTIFDNIK